jgi:hypothetical protein
VTDGVDAPVDAVQAAGCDAASDAGLGETGLQKLRDLDDAVLPRRDRGDRCVRTPDFPSHTDGNPGAARRAP